MKDADPKVHRIASNPWLYIVRLDLLRKGILALPLHNRFSTGSEQVPHRNENVSGEVAAPAVRRRRGIADDAVKIVRRSFLDGYGQSSSDAIGAGWVSRKIELRLPNRRKYSKTIKLPAKTIDLILIVQFVLLHKCFARDDVTSGRGIPFNVYFLNGNLGAFLDLDNECQLGNIKRI